MARQQLRQKNHGFSLTLATYMMPISGVIPSPAMSDAEHLRRCNTPPAFIVLSPTRLQNVQACMRPTWLQSNVKLCVSISGGIRRNGPSPKLRLKACYFPCTSSPPWCIYGTLASRVLVRAARQIECSAEYSSLPVPQLSGRRSEHTYSPFR